jgi:hypothetical protein
MQFIEKSNCQPNTYTKTQTEIVHPTQGDLFVLSNQQKIILTKVISVPKMNLPKAPSL